MHHLPHHHHIVEDDLTSSMASNMAASLERSLEMGEYIFVAIIDCVEAEYQLLRIVCVSLSTSFF